MTEKGEALYRIGRLEIPATILFGQTYGIGDVVSEWNPAPFILPPDVEEVRRLVVAEFSRRGNDMREGDGARLSSVKVADGKLKMGFQRASYTSIFGCHYAARYVDDPVLGPVVRPVIERYREVALDMNTSPLSNRPQLCAALVTSDAQTLVVKRSAKVLIDPGRRDTSVVGGVKPQKGDCETRFAIPFAAIIRQTREELGIAFDPAPFGSVVITAIAQDEDRLFQPGIVMAVFTPLRISAVLRAIERHAPDKWEGEAWLPIPFNPRDVGRMLLDATEMPGMGKLAFLGALATRFQMNEIVQALS